MAIIVGPLLFLAGIVFKTNRALLDAIINLLDRVQLNVGLRNRAGLTASLTGINIFVVVGVGDVGLAQFLNAVIINLGER